MLHFLLAHPRRIARKRLPFRSTTWFIWAYSPKVWVLFLVISPLVHLLHPRRVTSASPLRRFHPLPTPVKNALPPSRVHSLTSDRLKKTFRHIFSLFYLKSYMNEISRKIQGPTWSPWIVHVIKDLKYTPNFRGAYKQMKK